MNTNARYWILLLSHLVNTVKKNKFVYRRKFLLAFVNFSFFPQKGGCSAHFLGMHDFLTNTGRKSWPSALPPSPLFLIHGQGSLLIFLLFSSSLFFWFTFWYPGEEPWVWLHLAEACCATCSSLLSSFWGPAVLQQHDQGSRATRAYLTPLPGQPAHNAVVPKSTKSGGIWSLIKGSSIHLKETSFGFSGEESSCFELGIHEPDYL